MSEDKPNGADTEVESLVDEALGDVSWPLEPIDPVAATPDSGAGDPPQFVRVAIEDFHLGKFMWAANYFVLWPLGFALTVTHEQVALEPAKYCGDLERHDPHKFAPEGKTRRRDCMGTRRAYVDIHVREWTYPEGELAETIDQDPSENGEDYAEFLTHARERILAMKPAERKLALERLGGHSVLNAATLMVAA